MLALGNTALTPCVSQLLSEVFNPRSLEQIEKWLAMSDINGNGTISTLIWLWWLLPFLLCMLRVQQSPPYSGTASRWLTSAKASGTHSPQGRLQAFQREVLRWIWRCKKISSISKPWTNFNNWKCFCQVSTQQNTKELHSLWKENDWQVSWCIFTQHMTVGPTVHAYIRTYYLPIYC